MAGNYRRMWTDLNGSTLSNNPEIAAGRLDHLIKNLLDAAGLKRFTVSPGEIKPSKDKLYAVVPYTVVGVEGDMKAFARFLHDFYQQPYAMQITGFNLEPVSFRRGNTLRVSSMVIEALLLPTKGLPPSLIAAAQPAAPKPKPAAASAPTGPTTRHNGKLAARPAQSSPATLTSGEVTQTKKVAPLRPGRPEDADLEAYAVLWDKKFMEPYTCACPSRQKTACATPLRRRPDDQPQRRQLYRTDDGQHSLSHPQC